MADARGSRAQMALAFETTYGTPPGSGYVLAPFASNDLGATQGLIENELLGFGRDPIDPIRDVTVVSGDIGIPIDTVYIGYWLKLLMGAPVTTGEGPYTHTFTSGADDLPSMAVEKQFPDLPRYFMNAGVAADSLSWEMNRGAGQNLLATISLIAQGQVPLEGKATSDAGTPTEIAFKRFGHFAGSVKRNGASLGRVVSAQITYSNNLESIEVIRNDGLIDGVLAGIGAATGNVEVRFNNTVLLEDAANGTACALEFGYALASGESLTVTLPRVFLPTPKQSVDGPGGVQATFDWQAARQTDGGPMCTVALVNGVEAY